MKVNKIESYSPEYPSKRRSAAVKLGAAAAAAVLAASSTVGCLPRASGYMEYRPTDEPALTEIAEPTEEAVLMGDVAVETEPAEEPTAVPTETVELTGIILADPDTTVAPDDGEAAND